MKTKTLTLVISLSCLLAAGQAYQPFPDSCSIWNSVGKNVFSSALYEFRFGLCGDTVINGYTWSKVYNLVDTTLVSPGSSYFGAIREDAGRKVHFLCPGFDEMVLYDFSALPGDTLWYQTGGALCGDTFTFWPQTPHYRVVASVDSILLQNNEYRKRWNLTGGSMNDQWVEGIGSISWFGLFNPVISDIALCGDSYGFACFRQNGETLYLNNTNCSTCYCSVILADDLLPAKQPGKFAVVPNPAGNEFRLETDGTLGPYSIRLIAQDGRPVFERTGQTEPCLDVSVRDFPPGHYILIVTGPDQRRIGEAKVIVARF